MAKQKKFILQESEIPTQWYNIQADMPNKPLPPIHPATKQPLGVDDLAHIFPRECCVQELDTEHRWIDIPEDVLDKYRYYRSTPLVRAYALEEALGTPAHIYFKNESTNPLGSHKVNSAIPQCYYAKQEGTTNVTTETGAGQWGAALSYAAKLYGLDCAVYQVKITMQQKPYRSSIMRTFGAVVEGSPSMSTRAGKDILTRDPLHTGSLGTAISEAVELATTTPNCKYVLGSVLNHVGLHQTIIGLEAEKQMEMAGEYPDIVIGCFGGGSNFGGISFPFMRLHATAADVHPRPQLQAVQHPCWRSALPRSRHDYLPTYQGRYDAWCRYSSARDLRGRYALCPHRGYHPCTGEHPCHRRYHPRGKQVQGDWRRKGDPLQPFRPRPHRHAVIRSLHQG